MKMLSVIVFNYFFKWSTDSLKTQSIALKDLFVISSHLLQTNGGSISHFSMFGSIPFCHLSYVFNLFLYCILHFYDHIRVTVWKLGGNTYKSGNHYTYCKREQSGQYIMWGIGSAQTHCFKVTCFGIYRSSQI